MIRDGVSRNVKGFIEAYEVREGRPWRLLAARGNLIANQAADIEALALATGAAINGMYLVYENNGSATPITPDVLNTAATYATPSADRGLVRISTLGEPAIATSSDIYTGNMVSFVGVTDGSVFFPGVPVIDGTSSFYTAALVLMPDFTDQSKDLVFSCGDLSTAITKVAGAQIGLRWTLTFTNT